MAIEYYDSVFNAIFFLMEKYDDDDDSNKVTLFYLKYDQDNLLHNLSPKNQGNLVVLLIDSIEERTTQNLMLNENLSLCEDANLILASQICEMSSMIEVLESSNQISKEDSSTSEGQKRKLNIFKKNWKKIKSLNLSQMPPLK